MADTRRRFGKCIELRPECVEEYKRLHADGHAGVRDLLQKHGLVNFSIFLHEIRGAQMLFLYCEYTGSDYEADMAALSAEPRDVAWHKLCDNMQIDYPWKDMECVFRNP